MILKTINNLIKEAINKPSIEVLDANRIDITDDIAIIAFRVPKITNVCPSGFHTDNSSGYCVANNKKGVPRPFIKRGSTCPTGYSVDATSGYCRDNKRK